MPPLIHHSPVGCDLPDLGLGSDEVDFGQADVLYTWDLLLADQNGVSYFCDFKAGFTLLDLGCELLDVLRFRCRFHQWSASC